MPTGNREFDYSFFDDIPKNKRAEFFRRSYQAMLEIAQDYTANDLQEDLPMTEQQKDGPGNAAMKRYGLEPTNSQHLAAYLAAYEALENVPQRRWGGTRHEVAAAQAAKDLRAAKQIGEWQSSGHVPTALDLLSLDQEVRPEMPDPEPKTATERIEAYFRSKQNE